MPLCLPIVKLRTDDCELILEICLYDELLKNKGMIICSYIKKSFIQIVTFVCSWLHYLVHLATLNT